MIAVHKYVLDRALFTTILTHEGAKLCAIHEQGNQICLWLEVDTDRPFQERQYEVYATGQRINTPEDDRAFVGTVFLHDAVAVFHVYERA